jgi:hypothetical protein
MLLVITVSKEIKLQLRIVVIIVEIIIFISLSYDRSYDSITNYRICYALTLFFCEVDGVADDIHILLKRRSN